MNTTELLNFEYQQKVKNYTPYEEANIKIINYHEIRVQTEHKKTKEKVFEVVSQKSKIKPLDTLVMIYGNDRFKFFNSSDNLATGFVEEADYRDTLFFDHLCKVALIAKRKIIPYQPPKNQIVLCPEAQVDRVGQSRMEQLEWKAETAKYYPAEVNQGQGQILDVVKQYVDTTLTSIQKEADKIEKKKKKSRGKKEIIQPTLNPQPQSLSYEDRKNFLTEHANNSEIAERSASYNNPQLQSLKFEARKHFLEHANHSEIAERSTPYQI